MEQGAILLFLAYNGWLDLRKREICLWITGLFGVCGLICSFIQNREMKDLIISLGIGVIFLAISLFTHGEVGMGDGWILLSLGTILQRWTMVEMLGWGLLLSGICALVLLVIGKKSRKAELPFVPFLLLGYLGAMLL